MENIKEFEKEFEKELKKCRKYIENIQEQLKNYCNMLGLLSYKIVVTESKNEYNFYIDVIQNNDIIIQTSPKLNSYDQVVKYIDIFTNNISKFYKDLQKENLI